MIGGLVLAAGGGTRFGAQPKQLAELDGVPLLEHAIRAMEAVPAIGRIVVVLGAHAGEVAAAVRFGAAQPVVCEEWATGQAASLGQGVAALDDAEAIVVTLGDQPRIAPAVIARFAALGAAHGSLARARATYDGRPGHPVVLGRAYVSAVGDLRGDAGARDLLREIGAFEIECGGLGSADDVDTPEALEMMRR